jgi:hypothetical protein
MQSLLLFEEELELVLNNLQLLVRPTYCYLPLHLEEPPPIGDHLFQSAIVNGIDAVCIREVPRGQSWRCKHERVLQTWLNYERHSFTFSKALPFT